MSGEQRLGRYTLQRRLASGGMGEVYLAESEGAANFRKQVAIKRILPHLARDAEFVRKFIDEAHLMVQLHHGNIVPVLELADEEGELYLVMEYLPGRDLKAVIHRLRAQGRPMPPDLALWLIGEICAGLDYAHRREGPDGHSLRVVHRDVSPSNVVLGTGGEVKLVDFGIARARGALHQSISGTLQGKFVYMSPEQADGRPMDARSDIFSTGLVLYELLCGVRPFEGESETETLRRVREAKVPAPSHHLASLPPAIDAIVMRALGPHPEDRYGSSAEMRRAILQYLSDTRSETDAPDLAIFLRGLFPEGVIPQAPPNTPLSVDDALQLQLGGLTPSADRFGRTRTLTGDGPDGALTSAPASAPPRAPTAPSWAQRSTPPTQPQTLPTPAPARGRRRLLVAGLLVGAVVASVAGWLVRRPASARVELRVRPATAKVQLEIDGHRRGPDERFTEGQGARLCATAPGFERRCVDQQLAAGPNLLRLDLPTRLLLEPAISPPGVAFRVTARGGEVQLPFPLRRGEEYTVCVLAEGHRARPACRTLVADEATRRPAFELLPEVETPPAVADAGPPADQGTPAPRPRPTRRVEYITLETSPTAAVYKDGQHLGLTPLRLPIPARSARYELECKGYAPTPVVLSAKSKPGHLYVELDAWAKLTVRAEPSGAWIYIDDARVADGVLSAHRLRPGAHTLQARWDGPDGALHVSPVRKIRPTPGQRLRLAPLQVPLPGGSP